MTFEPNYSPRYTAKKQLNWKTGFLPRRIKIPSNTSWKTLLPLTSTKEKVQFHNRESVPSKHVAHRWHIDFQNNRKAKFDLNTFFSKKKLLHLYCEVNLAEKRKTWHENYWATSEIVTVTFRTNLFGILFSQISDHVAHVFNKIKARMGFGNFIFRLGLTTHNKATLHKKTRSEVTLRVF